LGRSAAETWRAIKGESCFELTVGINNWPWDIDQLCKLGEIDDNSLLKVKVIRIPWLWLIITWWS
jgi:hypothetical protein